MHAMNKIILQVFVGLLMLAQLPALQANETLSVYSSRKESLIKPLLDQFSLEKKVKIQLITGNDEALIERIKQTGAQVDVILLSDAGNLFYAKTQGVLQPFSSDVVENRVPPYWRDSLDGQHHWTGLSLRARTIIYNKTKVDPQSLSTYEQLGDIKWRKRLCLRTSKKIYNKSLVSSMIIHHGVNETRNILSRWVSNLATKPFAKDSQVIKAIAAGQCDVGIINTYYLGRVLEKTPNTPVGLFWANQANNGTHVNLSGAGIGKTAQNKALAIDFINWLISDRAQAIYANTNKEYPIIDGVALDPIVKSWGQFKADKLPLNTIGNLQAKAVELMRETGYQ